MEKGLKDLQKMSREELIAYALKEAERADKADRRANKADERANRAYIRAQKSRGTT